MHIKIVIRTLNLEPHPNCQYDYLVMRYGANFANPPFQSFCGKHPIENDTMIFRNNYLRINFHSDGSVSSDGFLIEYTFIDAGNSVLKFIYFIYNLIVNLLYILL